MSERARILVIRFSSIGDIVLTTPVIRALREQLEPRPEIHFLTKSIFARVLSANPNIDTIHTIERSTAEVSERLKALEFDYIVDLHSNIRSKMVKKRLKSLDFTFKKQNFEKWMLVRFGTHRDKITHVVDRYLECLRPFGIVDDGKGLDFHIDPLAAAEVDQEAGDLSSPFTAVALGATHVGKRMSVDLIKTVCRSLDHPVILLGGKSDHDSGDAIAEGLSHVRNLAGRLSIHGSAEVIRRSAQLLTGDTGMMHIGAALGKKIVSVWGCTDPVLGMSPYRADGRSCTILPLGRKKRPCSKLGDHCKYGKDDLCIDAVDPAEVITALRL